MTSRSRAQITALALLLGSSLLMAPLVTASASPSTPNLAHSPDTTSLRPLPDASISSIDFVATYSFNTGSSGAAQCWSHFAPQAPLGLPMAQTYRNCNGYALYVQMGYTDSNGFHPETNCGLVGNGETVIIVRWRTYAGNYSTNVC